MGIEAGKLRHLATLKSPSATPNAFGEQVLSYADAGQAYVSVQPLTGREAQTARSVFPTVTHLVRARAVDTSAVRASWRLVVNGRTYGVDAVLTPDDVEDDRTMFVTEVTL